MHKIKGSSILIYVAQASILALFYRTLITTNSSLLKQRSKERRLSDGNLKSECWRGTHAAGSFEASAEKQILEMTVFLDLVACIQRITVFRMKTPLAKAANGIKFDFKWLGCSQHPLHLLREKKCSFEF